MAKQNYCWSEWISFVSFSLQQFSAKSREPKRQLYFVIASLTKSCIEKKIRATALIDGGTKTKRPTLGGMFDILNKRCKLSDFTNYISNASSLQERVVSNTYCNERKFHCVERLFCLQTKLAGTSN